MSLERNVFLYKLVRLGISFHLPIFVLFFREIGLSFTQLMIISAIMNASQILFEVPSGAFADLYGRKRTLFAGKLMTLAGFGIVSLSHGFWRMAFAHLFLGASMAFSSGTDSSFIYDTLKALGKKEEFQRVEGSATSLSMASMGVTSLVGGWVAGAWGLRATMMLTFFCYVPVALAILLMEEPPLSKKVRDREYFQHLRESVRFASSHPRVRWLAFYGAFTIGLMLSTHRFLQPYLQSAGVPVSQFGIIYVVWLLASSYSAQKADALERWLGERKTLLLIPFMIVVGTLPLAFYAGIGGAFLYLVTESAYGLSLPIVKNYIHFHVESHHRATVLSLTGFLQNIFFVFTGPLFGAIADNVSLSSALAVQGLAALVILLGAWLWVCPEKNACPLSREFEG